MTTPEQLAHIAEANDFLDIRVLAIGGKVVALQRFIYTTGLLVGVDEYSYTHRYCFPNYADAREAFATWAGAGDPPGNWIKRKGLGGEYANPNYEP